MRPNAKIEETKSKIHAAVTTAQAILEAGFGKSVPTDFILSSTVIICSVLKV